MTYLGYIIYFVVSLAVALLTRQKPQTTNLSPDTFEQDAVSVGTKAPVLFGTRDIEPHVVWVGDKRTVPVKKSSGKK